MSSTLKITGTQARRLALHASLLYGKPKLPKGKDGVEEAIKHLGYTQIDTISVIARAHHHTLWTRCQDYKPESLDQLLADDKRIFEYWGHAMSYLPIEDYRFYTHAFKRFNKPDGKWSSIRFEKTRTLLPQIVKRIKQEGALGSKDFEAVGTKKVKGWWDFKPAKIGLELLYWQGKLMVSERQNFHRKYDLTKRVLPDYINTKTPTQKEQSVFWIKRALQSYGIATLSEIKKHNHQVDKKAIEKHLQLLLINKTVMEIEVDSLKDTYFALNDFIDRNYPIKKKADRLHILSPFDNAVILRDRMQRLFNFEYTIECYLPKPKRTFGYFVLPILWGDKLVGRLDAKADRKIGQLIVHNIYLENGFQPTELFIKAFGKKIQLFAKFNNCSSIAIKQTSPSTLLSKLSKQL